MPVIPGTILFTTLPVPRQATFIAGGTIVPNDIVYMDIADGLVKVPSAGTIYNSAITDFGGIVGVALSGASANGGVRVALIDANSELWLPNYNASSSGSSRTVLQIASGQGATGAYVLYKASSGANLNNYGVDLATTTSGIARVITYCDDSYSYQLSTNGTSSGVFTGNPSINTPKTTVAVGDLVRVVIPEASRWVRA